MLEAPRFGFGKKYVEDKQKSIKKYPRRGSNHRPLVCETGVLPIRLAALLINWVCGVWGTKKRYSHIKEGHSENGFYGQDRRFDASLTGKDSSPARCLKSVIFLSKSTISIDFRQFVEALSKIDDFSFDHAHFGSILDSSSTRCLSGIDIFFPPKLCLIPHYV